MRYLRGLLAAVVFSASCGAPTTPTPPPPPAPPLNTAPVIKSVVAAHATLEVDTSVEITATVEDGESAADTLTFAWSASVGTFSGQGARTTWKAPADLATPANVVLSLTVRESYLAFDDSRQLVTKEHSVTGTVTVRVHNSPKELREMSVSFLNKFATTSVSPDACVVDFSDSCSGKREELNDIRANREKFLVLNSSFGTPDIVGLAPFDGAELLVACSFESRVVKCLPGETSCVVGAVERAVGDCRLTAIYEQSRWWLCGSRFLADTPLTSTMKLFFGK